MLTQYKLAKYLNDEEKQAFLDGFYQEWRNELAFPEDLGSPIPWGCIWYHGNFGGETIIDCFSLETLELQGIKYFKICKDEIIETDGRGE